MMQGLIQLFKMSWRYVIQICMGILSFSAFFFLYAKYKTGKSFNELAQLYVEVISKAFIFTGLLLGAVFVLTEYVPTCHIVIFLLGISSFSILLKYFRVVQNKRTMAIDISIVLANVYCSYLLIIQDRFQIKDYLVLAGMSLCFFLYQQIKKIA